MGFSRRHERSHALARRTIRFCLNSSSKEEKNNRMFALNKIKNKNIVKASHRFLFAKTMSTFSVDQNGIFFCSLFVREICLIYGSKQTFDTSLHTNLNAAFNYAFLYSDTYQTVASAASTVSFLTRRKWRETTAILSNLLAFVLIRFFLSNLNYEELVTRAPLLLESFYVSEPTCCSPCNVSRFFTDNSIKKKLIKNEDYFHDSFPSDFSLFTIAVTTKK